MVDEPVKKWTQRWRSLMDGPRGGHGRSKVVVRADDSDQGSRYFLKILLRQEDHNRRARLYREVAAYRTLSHPRVPELVDTNAEQFADHEYELYLVAALVSGPTLAEHIKARQRLSLTESINVVDAILATLDHCHRNEVVHRDVKPDNVILRGGCADDPVLVDFGQALGDRTSFETEPTEELGNRFLRLPELNVGSLEKSDPRTDVTFAAGLLLYCLTGQNPSGLLNERSCMPHQREDIRAALTAQVSDKHQLAHLLDIFDRAFRWELSQRWPSADDLRKAVGAILDAKAAPNASAKVQRYAASPAVQSMVQVKKAVDRAIIEVHRVHSAVADGLKGAVEPHQTGFARVPPSGARETCLSLTKIGEFPTEHWLGIRAEVVASEVVVRVIRADGSEVSTLYRTALDAPVYGAAFEEAVTNAFLSHLGNFV